MNTLTNLLEVIKSGDFLVMHTRSTNYTSGELFQIVIIDSQENVLLDALCKPSKPLPDDVTLYYGVTDEMLANQPTWHELKDRIFYYVLDYNLILWNALRQRNMMHESADAWGIPKIDWKEVSIWWDLMDAFGEYMGEVTDDKRSNRIIPVATAAKQFEVVRPASPDCLDDAKTVLHIARAMLRLSEVKPDAQ